jgi:hypothetical protein
MSAETLVTLRHGLRRGGARHRCAVLGELTGADEARLAELGPGASPALRATALIAACVRSLGEIAPFGEAEARALTAGDRERLLLRLCDLSFRRPFEAVLSCPGEGCGETMEFGFSLENLLEEPESEPEDQDEIRLHVDAAGAGLEVRCRLPTGADQEAAAAVARRDPAAAGDAVLARCILAVSNGDGRPLASGALLAHLRDPLAEAFAARDPDAETAVRAGCPACGTEVTALLDAESFLAAELARSDGIFGEVDRLARSYHWSEAEILALGVSRRRRYLALLGDAA